MSVKPLAFNDVMTNPMGSKQAGTVGQPMPIYLSRLQADSLSDIYFGQIQTDKSLEKPTRQTGIIATLGPASASPEKIRELMLAGVNIFRQNFSHGTQEIHGQWIDMIRTAEADLKKQGKLDHDVSILADVQGPKIRVGKLASPIQLEVGKTIYLKHAEALTDGSAPVMGSDEIPITLKAVTDSLKAGNKVLMDDGKKELKVIKPLDAQGRVECVVVRGGELTSNKGMNLPDVKLNTPALSEKDKSDMAFAASKGVDYIAVSFIRNAEDMEAARQYLRDLETGIDGKPGIPNASAIKLIAKIEKPEAVEKKTLRGIVKASDGVMVARGDLGIEVPIEKLPKLQEKIIREARSQNKLAIVATQMLESMMENTQPSRADVSDIADAVKDRANFVMLSGETSVGKFPVEVVSKMASIIDENQPDHEFKEVFQTNLNYIKTWFRQKLAKLRHA